MLYHVSAQCCYLPVRSMTTMTIDSKLRSSLEYEEDHGTCLRCKTLTPQRKCSTCSHLREVKLQSGEWFYRQIHSRFQRPAALTENNKKAIENGVAMDPESTQVREFIERLVEALVSGQLDDVKVNRLYSHPEYDRMFSCHHTALCESLVRLSFALQMAIANKPVSEEDTPSAVHTDLKQRVQHIIQEAMTLPNLKMNNISQVPTQNGSSLHKWEEDITSMTYEDILATAILNKVIERFQQKTGLSLRDSVDGNSNLLADCRSSPSEMEQSPKYISQVEIGVNRPSSLEDGDTSSQEGLRSWSESSPTEPMSMTIEECIEEEVTTYDSAGEEDDRSSDGVATTTGSELDFYLSGLNMIKQRRVPFPELGVDIIDGPKEEESNEEDEHSESSNSPKPTDLVSPVDSWEENWLFQRRRLKAGGATQACPMPVPMLVPNPSEDFRARIGDRDAEEVSDLSDCSDGALEDIVLAGMDADIHHRDVSLTSLDEDIEEDIIPEVNCIKEIELIEATNTELTKSSSVECLSEFGQQDSEYTEDYASVTQRQLSSLTEVTPTETPATKSPVPVPRPRNVNLSSQTTPQKEENSSQDSVFAIPPRPGTIAEREHRKWECAPPLPNNPYSPENISKRLSKQSVSYSSRSSSCASIEFTDFKNEPQVPTPMQVACVSSEPDYKRYGRDYYINQSKVASGERRSSSRVTSPQLEQRTIELVNHTAEKDQLLKIDSPTEEISQLQGHVENEIAKWQKEINHTEQQWLKKLQHNNSIESDHSVDNKSQQNNSVETDKFKEKENNAYTETDKNINSKQQNNIHVGKQKQNTVVVKATQNGSVMLNGSQPSIKLIKAPLSSKEEKSEKLPYLSKTTISKNNHNPKEVNSQLEKMFGKTERNIEDNCKNLVQQNKKLVEVRKWKNSSQERIEIEDISRKNCDGVLPERKKSDILLTSGSEGRKAELSCNGDKIKMDSALTPSDCSNVSSDLDLDADIPIVLPSVKELAKHFSGGGTSDSDSSISKAVPSPRCKVEIQTKIVEPSRSVLIVEKEKRTQPVREIHSLTARSISREFREGLRRNLPTQLDRNLHVATDNMAGEKNSDIDICNNVGDSSCSSPDLIINGDGDITSSDNSINISRSRAKYGSIKEINEVDAYGADIEATSKSQTEDSTHGYTSDESGTQLSISPVIGRRKLQNNIAFWEELQRNNK